MCLPLLSRPNFKTRDPMFQVITTQASVNMCNATVDFLEDETPPFPPTVNNKTLHLFYKNVSVDMLGIENYVETYQ